MIFIKLLTICSKYFLKFKEWIYDFYLRKIDDKMDVENDIMNKSNNYMIDVFDNYLSANTDYAVMLTGDWGAGKTFFVQNELADHIHDNYCGKNGKYKEVIYLSLFNYETITQVYNSIATQVALGGLDDYQNSKAEKITGTVHEKHGFMNISGIETLIDVTGKLADDFIKGSDKIKKWSGILSKLAINHSKYVYIIDDIERCKIDLDQIFGFIDYIANQNKAKIIIICNEDKIKDKIESTKKDSNNSTNTNTMNSLSFKEKVVGLSIKYVPDFSKIYDIIVCKYSDEQCKEILLEKEIKDEAIKCAYILGSYNLRTMNFAVSSFCRIFGSIQNLIYANIISKEQYFIELCKVVFLSILCSAVFVRERNGNILDLLDAESKEHLLNEPCKRVNLSKSANINNGDIFNNVYITVFPCLNDFVHTFFLDENKFVEAVKFYISYLKANDYTYDKKINLVWQIPEKEGVKILQEVYIALQQNKLYINSYPRIVVNLFELCEVLEQKNLLQQIKLTMDRNCKQCNDTAGIFGWSVYAGDNQIAREFIDDLYRILRSNNCKLLGNRLKQIFSLTDNSEFSNQFDNILIEEKGKIRSNFTFLGYLSADIMIERMKILEVHQLVHYVDGIINYYKDDNKGRINHYSGDKELFECWQIRLRDYISGYHDDKMRLWYYNRLLDFIDEYLKGVKN